jgi:hypothetical protein
MDCIRLEFKYSEASRIRMRRGIAIIRVYTIARWVEKLILLALAIVILG